MNENWKIVYLFDTGEFALSEEKQHQMADKIYKSVPPVHTVPGTIAIVEGYIITIDAIAYDIDKEVIQVYCAIQAANKHKSNPVILKSRGVN